MSQLQVEKEIVKYFLHWPLSVWPFTESFTPVRSVLLLLLMILFALQGLAIVHHRGTKKGVANTFFVFLYIFLAILPHFIGAILTFVGIVDNVADFRKLRRSRGRG